MTLVENLHSEPDIKRFNLNRCYQCKTCSAGCPFGVLMDYLPHQVVQKARMGLIDDLLQSRSIWYCASCETCYTRCPQGVDIPGLVDFLRVVSNRKGTIGRDRRFLVFHRMFLGSIRRWGRQYEMGFLLGFKIRVMDLWGDLKLGMKLLLKRKLGLLPPKNPDGKDIKGIFRRVGWKN